MDTISSLYVPIGVALAVVVLFAYCFSNVKDKVSQGTLKEIYGNPAAKNHIRVANGGAGPTGVIRALSDAFLKERSDLNLSIGWVQSISKDSLSNIKDNFTQIALTYDPQLEKEMVQNGQAKNYKYIFNDHFLLLGPKNHKSIKPTKGIASREVVLSTFVQISKIIGEKGKPSYVTRDDGSGTHAKELSIWEKAGVSIPPSNDSWFYRMPADKPRFPADCLRLSLEWGSFCLVDRGTFLMNAEAQKNMDIYLQGGEDENDILLNPCHALVTAVQSNLTPFATEFVNFMASEKGQSIIKTFGIDKPSNLLKIPLYTPV